MSLHVHNGYEWDEGKSEQNLRDHSVSFEHGEGIFADDLAIVIPDERHDEPRQKITGSTRKERFT